MVEGQGFPNQQEQDPKRWQSYEEKALWVKHQSEASRRHKAWEKSAMLGQNLVLKPPAGKGPHSSTPWETLGVD
jgi:hypothetical protein